MKAKPDNEYLRRAIKAQGVEATWTPSYTIMPPWDWTKKRSRLTRIFGFAIPCDEALDTIARYDPIVEIGAGAGYWAYLLRQRGVDIVAYDPRPYGVTRKIGYRWRVPWTTVLPGNHRTVRQYPDRTLLLIWPSYDKSWAYLTLKYYRGDRVIYVGEENGCTADDRFRKLLDRQWEPESALPIPQWWGMHDALYVYTRR